MSATSTASKNSHMSSRIRKARAKYISAAFANRSIVTLFRFALLIGISFIIIYPFIVKFTNSLMSPDDLLNKTVKYVPMMPTLDNYKYVIQYGKYWEALRNTGLLSLFASFAQVFVCLLVGYGFAKFNFRFKKLFFALVIFTLIIPPQTITISLYMRFKFFDVLNLPFISESVIHKTPGLIELITGQTTNLIGSPASMLIMSMTGLGLRNGLFIFISRQFFTGVPDELIEAAYVDGSGVYYTFFKIMMPISRPIMVTVFLLSFAWQWTDTLYTDLLLSGLNTLPHVLSSMTVVTGIGAKAGTIMSAVMQNTSVILIIIPIVIIYIFTQRLLIQGVERSGLVG